MLENNKNTGISILKTVGVLGIIAYFLALTLHIKGTGAMIAYFGNYGYLLLFIISGFFVAKSLDGSKDARSIFKFYAKKAVTVLLLYYLFLILFIGIWTLAFNRPLGRGVITYIFPAYGIYPNNLNMILIFVHIYVVFILIAPIIFNLLKLNKTWKLAIVFLVFYALDMIQSRYFNGWGRFFNFGFTFIQGMLLYTAIKEKKTVFIYISALFIACGLIALDKIYDLLVSVIFVILIGLSEGLEIKNKAINKTFAVLDEYCYPALIATALSYIIFANVSVESALLKTLLFAASIIVFAVIFREVFVRFAVKPLNSKIDK